MKKHNIKQNRKQKILLLVFVIALMVRVLYVSTYPQLPLINDAQAYVDLGQSIATSKGFTLDGIPNDRWPPGYPFFLSLFFRIFGDGLIAIRLVQALLGGITAILVFQIAKKYFGEKTGYIAGLITAGLPGLIFYTGMILTETIYTFFLVLIFWLLLTKQLTNKIAMIVGALFGITALIRSETVALPFFMLAILWIKKRKIKKQFVLHAAIIILLMFAVILPWSARNHSLYNQFFLIDTHGGSTLWISTYPQDWQEWNPYPEGLQQKLQDLTPKEQSKILTQEAFKNLKDNPKAYVKMSAKRFVRFWVGSHTGTVGGFTDSFAQAKAQHQNKIFVVKGALLLINSVVILLGLLGAWYLIRKEKSIAMLVLLSPILFKMILHTLTFATSRYHLPILPFMAILCAYILCSKKIFVEHHRAKFLP